MSEAAMNGLRHGLSVGECTNCGVDDAPWWDRTGNVGPFCQGCKDILDQSFREDGAMTSDLSRAGIDATISEQGEHSMVIGRLHIADGFIAERTHDPERPIRFGLTHGGDPFNINTPMTAIDMTEAQAASLIAHIARRGESGETYRAALAFLQATGIEHE